MADLREFDVQGALDAGYSGAQVQWHLMKELGYPPALAKQATAPREKMGPPEAPRTIGMPSDTSFSDAMSNANPMPDWYQRADAAVNQPFSMQTTGGPVGSLADVAPVIPQSKTEAVLLAAGALIPAGKALAGAKGALKAGTSMLEGAVPEVGAISKALNETINARNTLYHATDEVGLEKIIQSGEIRPGLTPGVSLSRVPRTLAPDASKFGYPTASQPVVMELDAAQVPRNAPTTHSGLLGKTENNAQNPWYEFENRTQQNAPVPVSAVKRILVDDGVLREIAPYDRLKRRTAEQFFEQIKAAADRAGIPVERFESGKSMAGARAKTSSVP